MPFFYEIRGRHFIEPINRNLDEIDKLKKKCQDVARHFGFDADAVYVEVPNMTHLIKWGGIRQDTDDPRWIRTPDGHLVPEPDKEPELYQEYIDKTANLHHPLRVCQICHLPDGLDDFPQLLLLRDKYYFVAYRERLEEMRLGIVPVSEDYVRNAEINEERKAPNEQL